MKVTADMSQRKRKNLLNDIAIKAHQFGGVLAGGYVRDFNFHQVPKDIDIFIRKPMGFTREQAIETATKILAVFGQTPGPNERLEQYGNEGNVVVKSTGESDDYEPIDVIFHTDPHAIWSFDLNCCKIFAEVGALNRVSIVKSGDFRLTENRGYETIFHWTPIEYIEHYKRIKDKINGIKLKYSFEDFGAVNNHEMYRRLIQEGLIEDPRQVFPQEAPRVNGDEVRLEAGNGARVRFEAARDAIVRMADEARADIVRDQARVQPRLQAEPFQWFNFDGLAGRG